MISKGNVKFMLFFVYDIIQRIRKKYNVIGNKKLRFYLYLWEG